MKRIAAIVAVVLVLAGLALLPLPWPEFIVGTRIQDTVDIAAPPPQVFAYVATPANWPQWHPESRAVRGVTERTPAVGESVTETYEIAGRRDEAVWTTVELDVPRRWRFRTAKRGGMAEIAYALTPQGAGTRFHRELHYRMPNLALAAVNYFELRDIEIRDSAQALANIKRQVEGH